jgi:hypothetical protein
LFLQISGHDFRPKFTVLSHPGADYVGGGDFFGPESRLVDEFPLADLEMLSAGGQPAPSLAIPKSLVRALDTFMIGATFKRKKDVEQNCAFLCHVSTRTADHRYMVTLLRRYQSDLTAHLEANNPAVLARLKAVYDDLASTHAGLAAHDFRDLVDTIRFFLPGISIKLVNGETDEDVAVESPYNLFVGGNKLGRGVTIKNLLVSYYGRNPRRPQADTVLQHARMYGYRRKDIGLLRLFLPNELHTVFRAINEMETALRDLIARKPNEEFRGVYLQTGLSPTRRSVLAPGSIGVYSGGGTYNPAQMRRDDSVVSNTAKIDAMLDKAVNKGVIEMSIADITALIAMTMPDQSQSERVWDPLAVAESVKQLAKLKGLESGYVYVDRNRGLEANRRETQGITEGGEAEKVAKDKLTLFMLKTTPHGAKKDVWWPQIRFPTGQYAFAFAI